MWCYGFRRLGGSQEFEELERRRRKIKIESIYVSDGALNLHIKNLKYECTCGFLKIQLVELLEEPEEHKHHLRIFTPAKRADTLASYTLTSHPVEDEETITLHTKSKLQKGHKYKLVISTEHKTYNYNFTINESGNITPIRE